ncbi:hypothetical protein HFN89_05800 [Rhizobium laguerreae]|nr:hypothetical protein [Rhizobium laguerreae]
MTFTNSWRDGAGGEKIFETANLSVIVRPDLEGWMLSCELEDFKWCAATLSDLEGPFYFLRNYAAEKSGFLQKPPEIIRRPLRDGLSLDARRHAYGSFEIRLRSPAGIVGRYDGHINRAMGSFVLGCISISASEWLVDSYRRQGLGDLMRDAAEEIMGLPAVPHGRNFVHGVLSCLAAKSWSKRAASRNVHGFASDPALEIPEKLGDEK